MVHEVPLAAEPCNAQQARHGPLPQCQEGADEQDLGVLPGAVDEQGRKRDDEPGEAGGRRGMVVSLGRDTLYLAVTSASSPNLQNGQSRA